MKLILPGATFIGFTGTLLMKADKEKSIEVFGPYIHRYKYDEAVQDKVVLDLMYEAREIDQKQTVPGVLQKCENIAGVQAKEWYIKNMRTKWGTCNIEKRRIWLNLQLAKKTPECLEYVIIHELVHFLERNHNERFCGYMNHFCPNWREIKENLNQQILDHFSGNEGNSHEPAL